MRTRLIAGAALFVACTPNGEQVSSFGDHGAAAASSSSGDTSRGDTTTGGPNPGEHSTSDTGTGQDSPPIDMGAPPDFPPAGPPGCQGKIDFLFLISDGLFMEPHQNKLVAAYPAFMQTIADEFAGFDTHILVTSTNYSWGSGYCADCLYCPDCTCDIGGPDYPCGAGPQLTECDDMRGAGIVFPAGIGATNHRCDLGGPQRYITAAAPDPAAAFACIARLGWPGPDSTAAIDSMFAAIDDDMLGPDGCNAGFLRDDALLVVTLIDAYGDYASDFTPPVWAWMLRDKKGGVDDGVVVLAIEPDRSSPDGLCKPPNDSALRLHEFADEMTHGVKGSMCADDYTGYFAEAVHLARQLCEPVPR